MKKIALGAGILGAAAGGAALHALGSPAAHANAGGAVAVPEPATLAILAGAVLIVVVLRVFWPQR